MAWHAVTKSCGHQQDHQIYGPNTRGQRDWKARQLAKDICDDCKTVGRDQLNARAADAADHAGWQTITGGSDRQTAWATTIRGDAMAAIADAAHTHADKARRAGWIDHRADALAAAMIRIWQRAALRQTDASWWIDNRDNTVDAVRRVLDDADRAEYRAEVESIEAGDRDPQTETETAPADDTPPTAQAAITTLRNSGWTAAKLAAELGVHRSTVYRWQHGQRTPNARNAAAIALLTR